MSCSVTIKNLSAARNGDLLYEGISFNVSHKEKIAIIGPNGCGKTTLLEIIAGLQTPHSGSFELFHHPITSTKEYAPFRQMIGYLFQDSDNQFLSPVVKDDIAFSLFARGMEKEEVVKRVEIVMEDLDIAHLADKIVYNLSGGEKKLVALAGVLVTEPKVMLLDEPTNGLDKAMQLKLINILKKIDKSIIVVSHHQEFIDSLVDVIYEITPTGLIRHER